MEINIYHKKKNQASYNNLNIIELFILFIFLIYQSKHLNHSLPNNDGRICYKLKYHR